MLEEVRQHQMYQHIHTPDNENHEDKDLLDDESLLHDLDPASQI